MSRFIHQRLRSFRDRVCLFQRTTPGV